MLAGLLLLGLAVGAGAPARSTGDTGLDLELGASVRAGAGPARRSDPAEARARRQKLLHQAMRNMGIGPFSGPRPPSSAPPAAPAPGAQAAASAASPQPAQPAQARNVPAPSSVEQGVRKALLEAAPRAKEPNFFLRLGLSPSASREEVKQAFLSLARKFHPDRFASPALADLSETVKEFFTAVNEAYETLADDKKRAAYLAQRGAAGVVQPEVAKIDFTKGDACLRTRDWARARSFFEAAIRADPRAEYKAALALAILADPTASRDRDRARVLAEEAVRDPSCDRAAYVAGILARDDKDPSTAERHFRAALVLNPRNADAVRELRLLGRKVR
jgi:curved DNA-binding protein CbpA